MQMRNKNTQITRTLVRIKILLLMVAAKVKQLALSSMMANLLKLTWDNSKLNMARILVDQANILVLQEPLQMTANL